MDDRHAQFLIVVPDACLGAELGQLIVEVLTIDGVRYRGVPTEVEVEQPDAVDGGTLGSPLRLGVTHRWGRSIWMPAQQR